MIENAIVFPAYCTEKDTETPIIVWLFALLTFGLYAIFTGYRRNKEIPCYDTAQNFDQAWGEICKDYPDWTQKSELARNIESAGYELN